MRIKEKYDFVLFSCDFKCTWEILLEDFVFYKIIQLFSKHVIFVK